MSVSSTVSGWFHKVWTLLKHEPVAVWGVVLAAVLGVLPLIGVSTSVVVAIGAILSLLGIPVVRGKVTPLEALEALIKGLESQGKLTSLNIRRGLR